MNNYLPKPLRSWTKESQVLRTLRNVAKKVAVSAQATTLMRIAGELRGAECYISLALSCVNPIVSAAEEFLVPVPSSPSNIWFPKESPTTINAISEEAGKGADEKWMSKCLDHKELHSPPEKSKIVVRSANHSEGSGMSAQSSPSSEGEVLQGPLTPFSKGSTPGWMPSPLTRFRVKATPVAYPFNLVKPCSAHGDVTLSDINQRIKVSSPSSSRRQPPRDGEKSPTQSGSGLSGKAVVECIKLHTEGKGSITIMKTRG